MQQLTQDPQTGSTHPIRGEKLYLFFLYGGVMVALAGLLGVSLTHNESGRIVPWLVFIGGVLTLLAAQVQFLVLLYRVWRHVIAESERLGLPLSIETPGKAIGLLFVPFFNLYWIFVALGSLPRQYNAVAAAENRPGRLSRGLGISISILALVGAIPYVGFPAALVNVLGLYPLFITRAVQFCRRAAPEPEALQPAAIESYASLFDFTRFGFNWYLAGALFFSAVLYPFVELGFAQRWLRPAFASAPDRFYTGYLATTAALALPSALAFFVILHFARRDWLMPILAAAAVLGVGFLRPLLLSWFLPEIRISAGTVTDMVLRFALGGLAMVCTIIFVRSVGATLLSFVAANVCYDLSWTIASIVRTQIRTHGGSTGFDIGLLVGSVAAPVLSAALFYGALSYHLEERGFRLLRKQIIPTL